MRWHYCGDFKRPASETYPSTDRHIQDVPGYGDGNCSRAELFTGDIRGTSSDACVLELFDASTAASGSNAG